MPNYVTVALDDVDRLLNAEMYDAGAVVRLESCATQAGVYASEGTSAIVSGTEIAVFYDTDGTTSTWYRTRYENAGGTVTSSYSAPFQVAGHSSAYAELDLFRRYVRNQGTDLTDEDSAFEIFALEAAARAIDRECGRSFTLATGTVSDRVFTAGVSVLGAPWGRRYALDTDDFFTATGLVVNFDATGDGSYTTACTSYRVGPVNAPSKGMPYNVLTFDSGVYPPVWSDGVQVTADWGWNAIPSGIIEANLIQASRFLKRRDSPYGVAGSPEMGNELRLLARLDPDVALLVRAWKLDWGYQ